MNQEDILEQIAGQIKLARLDMAVNDALIMKGALHYAETILSLVRDFNAQEPELKVPISYGKVHEQRTDGDICPYCEITRLREAFSKFINDVYENKYEADKLLIYIFKAKQVLKGGE